MSIPSCPICKSPVIGRSDKKYCSDYCRAMANRDQRIKSEEKFAVTNSILRHNRNVLNKLCPHGKAMVERHIMESLGYNFNFFTSVLITSSKTIYYTCYDYAFTPVNDAGKAKAIIVRRNPAAADHNPWQFMKRK